MAVIMNGPNGTIQVVSEPIAVGLEQIGWTRQDSDPAPQPDVEDVPDVDDSDADDGKVSCDVDGCDYRGTERGLKIHTGQVHSDDE